VCCIAIEYEKSTKGEQKKKQRREEEKETLKINKGGGFMRLWPIASISHIHAPGMSPSAHCTPLL
jgi:hypothetical protein